MSGKKVSTSKLQAYPKSIRLKSAKVIEALFRHRFFIIHPPLRLSAMTFGALPNGEKRQFLVAVSKKRFPRAVDRNRIKRLMREAIRLNQSILDAGASTPTAFALQYVGKRLPDFAEVSFAIQALFNRYLLTNEVHPTDTDEPPAGAD